MDLENTFTVYEVTSHIKHILENSLSSIQIEGEVANIARPNSGHIYFSLKDDKALIRCVFFSSFGRTLDFVPIHGDKVIVTGRLTVYERDGNYQILVNKIIPYGKGILHLQFELLKEKLKKEGLFDNKFKKSLPRFPNAIGVITSETGAVLQDILNIISRRFPLDVYLYPAIVQGAEAPQSLIDGIEYFQTNKPIVDVIIIGRGGGSFEDLFCFNNEQLIRAIFKCKIPVISAVGHETDFTICDFVADIRAATPSVAAELAVPNKAELISYLQHKRKQIHNLVSAEIADKKHRLLIIEKKINEKHPQNLIHKLQQHLDAYAYKIESSMQKAILYKKNEIILKKQILAGLSPTKIIQKGYAIIKKDGKLVNSITNLKQKDNIKIILKDGECQAEILNLSDS